MVGGYGRDAGGGWEWGCWEGVSQQNKHDCFQIHNKDPPQKILAFAFIKLRHFSSFGNHAKFGGYLQLWLHQSELG